MMNGTMNFIDICFLISGIPSPQCDDCSNPSPHIDQNAPDSHVSDTLPCQAFLFEAMHAWCVKHQIPYL